MSFNTIDAVMGSTLMEMLGESVTYRKCNGETISTNAEIDFNIEVFGDYESGVAETRTEILLLKADIGEPKRGDVIITAGGTNYIVQDWLEGQSDDIDIRVSVK